jgi:N-acetylneuraminic acid mutarotase
MSTARAALVLLLATTIASAALAGGPLTFSSTGSLATARHSPNAILLSNGTVLVAGGVGSSGFLTSAELYNPAAGAWKSTGSMTAFRAFSTGTLLRDGRVLMAGGGSSGSATAELYDPISGTWTATGSMSVSRREHTATLLRNGKVLVCGGSNNNGPLASAELYDPASRTWSNTGSLSTTHDGHTATLLPNGKVLVTAGYGGLMNNPSGITEIYDPASGTWSSTASLIKGRGSATATLLPSGKVLVAGGSAIGGTQISAELFDPQTSSWTQTGNLVTARFGHSATLLPNGKVLITGGQDGNGNAFAGAELYDPANGLWSATSSLNGVRDSHAATLLASGEVLVVGGDDGTSTGDLARAELYEPAIGTWANTGSLVASHGSHTATILPDGRVVVAGGADVFGVARSLTEIYDPVSGTWAMTGNLATARQFHTATLLINGKVLVAGGVGAAGNPSASCELFDPATGTWSAAGNLGTARDLHTATLLPNGKVYVAGGEGAGGGLLASAELYDPETGNWTATGNLMIARRSHTATLLPNGKVLVVLGFNSGNSGNAELYDPASGSTSTPIAFFTTRYSHTATLLPDGKVLVIGGRDASGPVDGYIVYDPATGVRTLFTSTVGTTARYDHTATLLPNGKVLVAGGTGSNGALSSTELYEFGRFSSGSGLLGAEHTLHTATLLLSGKVLVAGGRDANGNSLLASELYEVGLKFNAAWQPQITTSPTIANRAAKLSVGGVRFQGISQGSSGGFQDSSTNYPVVQLRNIDNNQVSYFLVDPAAGWSDTSSTSVTLTSSVPLGPSLLTVFTNGIPSAAKYLVVSPKSTQALNIATRLKVQQNDNILIGGFIVTGNAPKKVIVRGIGQSLKINGVPLAGRLANPLLELHDEKTGLTIETNDNWKINDQTGQSQQAAVEATTVPPTDDLESAIVRTLTPGPYTAILRGVNNSTGIGVVEVYDLDQAADSEMANISTRGLVDTGDNVMIGGFILGGSSQGSKILIRGIGPSLTAAGIANALGNPTLELHDGNGTLVATNDNWKLNDQTQQSQETEVRATTIPPSNDLESAILTTLSPGNYTAILSDKNAGTGVAVVEVYNLH